MLHPSYLELMNAVNANAETTDGKPVVTSRYSIVVAAAKRARQLIEEEVQEADNYVISKPLSTAINELMDGKVKIIPGDEDFSDFTESAILHTRYGTTMSLDSDDSESDEDSDYRDDADSYDSDEDSYDDDADEDAFEDDDDMDHDSEEDF